jgi:hypothetical protein
MILIGKHHLVSIAFTIRIAQMALLMGRSSIAMSSLAMVW